MKEIFNLFFRCADNDPTVEIYSNGESHQSRFKFQMFKWRWSGDPLFLHCEVDICNKSTEECTSRDQAVSYFFSLDLIYDKRSCESLINIFIRDATEKVWSETGEIWRLNQQWNLIWRSPTESWLWVPWWSPSTICSLMLLRVDLLMKVSFLVIFAVCIKVLTPLEDAANYFRILKSKK